MRERNALLAAQPEAQLMVNSLLDSMARMAGWKFAAREE
jgi:hypothetical protein